MATSSLLGRGMTTHRLCEHSLGCFANDPEDNHCSSFAGRFMPTRFPLLAFTAIVVSCCSCWTNAQTVDDIPKLIEELKAGSSARAIPAAERLARLGPEAQPATAALTDALASRDAQVRIAAADAL